MQTPSQHFIPDSQPFLASHSPSATDSGWIKLIIMMARPKYINEDSKYRRPNEAMFHVLSAIALNLPDRDTPLPAPHMPDFGTQTPSYLPPSSQVQD